MSSQEAKPNRKKGRSLAELYEETVSATSGNSMHSDSGGSSRVGTRRSRMLRAMDAPSFERHKEIGSLFLRKSQESDDTRLTVGRNVLSWDCGITNLCYCLLELEETQDGELGFRVIMWENFSLNSQTLMQATATLVKELDSRPWMMDVDSVCIENQVLKNVQMKVMSHAIQCYFETRGAARARDNTTFSVLPNGIRIARKGAGGPSVHFIKADSKFKAVTTIPIPQKIEKLSRRLRNKRAAIYLAKELLKQRGYTTELNFLESFDKQDDLSDAFLQGLYFLKQQKTTQSNSEKLKRYMGMKEVNTIDISKPTKKKKSKLKLDETTGTHKEEYDAIHDGLNEGCEYDKEVPLPQMYKNKAFVVPRYDTTKADISMVTRYMRNSLTIEKEEEEETEADSSDDEEILNYEIKNCTKKENV